MSDYSVVESYHETVDSTNIGSRGNYIQTHISNQGIVRIFYTDTSGDASAGTKDTIMCSIVDRSNTRQVIYNSAYKRTEINDISMNVAKHGQNFKTYVYRSSPSNDSVFGEGGINNSNINKFYIFPMRFKDAEGSQLYNKEGYSTTLGKWWDGYFSGMALNIKNGWYAQLSGNVPDNYRFVNPIQTMTNALTEPNNWGEHPNMIQKKFTEDGTKIQENTVDNIIGNFSCAIAPTNQIYNNAEYNKQFVLWLEYDNDSSTTLGYNLSYYVSPNYVSNADGNAENNFIFTGVKSISSGNSQLDCMPYSDIDLDISWNVVSTVSINLELKTSDVAHAESNSNIYVQVSNDGNTWYAPGTPVTINIPHTSDSETTSATLFSAGIARNTSVSQSYTISSNVTQIRFINNGDDRLFVEYFRLDGTDMIEIQGVIDDAYWPTTSVSLGWSGDFQQDAPIRTFSIAIPTSNTNNKGTFGRPYFIIRDQQNNRALLGYADLNYNDVSNPYQNDFTSVIGPGNILGAGGYDTKFHKIKCEKKSLENPGSWDTTGIHICFQKPGLSSNPSSLIYYKYKGPMSGTPLNEEEFNRDPIAGGNSATGKNPGGFCSMDVWGDNPRIAWYDSSFNSGSIWLAKSNNGGITWDSSGVMIDDNVGIYEESGNKNYLSLTCDQKDGSVHISYFHQTEGVKYWTNSPNAPRPITRGVSIEVKDINAVDTARRFNINNSIIVGPADTGLPKRFDESNIDISWNQVDSFYNAIFSYRHPITDWNEIPNYVTMTDSIVYSKTKTKYYTGDFDKIFVAARVKTNSTIYNGINSLFLIGGQTGNDGSYIGGISYGAPYFGIQNNYLSSSEIKTVTDDSSSLNPIGDLDSQGAFYLNPNTDYDLEFYYDKIKKYAFIKVNQSGEQEKLFEWYDISQNGGYNMSDGFLTIGNGSHTTEYNLWRGEKKDGIIKSIMIWNCDIDNVPQYKLYRSDSGGDYVETKSNIKTPYFKDSSGVTLDNIPTLNTDYRYKVSSMGNSINVSQNISADETKSPETLVRQFKDMWYMDYIKNQPLIDDIPGNIYVTAMDRLDNNVWATMSQDTGSGGNGNDDIYLVYSTDGGQSWQYNTSFSRTTVLNNVKNVMARCLKLYRDPSGAEWCFIGTEGYGIFVSHTYLQDNPLGEQLGTTWMQLSDGGGTFLSGAYLKNSSSLEDNRTITYIHPVDIVKSNSATLYGDIDSTGNSIANNAFHVWIGTESPWNGVIGNIDYSGPGGTAWARTWNSGTSSQQNDRDANLYNFTCVAYSMVVKINGKLYESSLSKIRLRGWTSKRSGSEEWYEPMFQTPDTIGSQDNGFVKPENFVEWRAYRSPEVITALNTGPIASGDDEGENEFSKKYKEIGFDVYLGGAPNTNPSQGGISPKVTARTDPDYSYTYSAWLSVSPWLDGSYNWYYTDSFSDFDVDTSRQKYPTYKKIGGSTGAQDWVIRGNYIDYSNNTLDYSKNIITYAQAFKGEGKILVSTYGTQPLVAFAYSHGDYGAKEVLSHVPGISNMTKIELINEITENWVIGIEQQNGDGTGRGNFKLFNLDKSATHEVSNNNEDHTWMYLNVNNDSNEFHGINGNMAFIKFYRSDIDNVPNPDPSLENFNVIDFGVEGTDVNIGYIGGKHNIYKTIDGGKTWTSTLLNSYDYNNRPGNSYLVGGSINGIFSKSRLISGNTDFVYKSNNSSIRIENDLSEFSYFESLGDNYNNGLKFKAYIPEKPNIGLSITESNNSSSSYWDYKNTSTYARIGGGNLIGDSKFKVDISGNNSNFWMFDHKNSIIKGSNDLLFHKDTSDKWQRIEITDPILDISAGITCMQPLQDSNLLVWVSDISKNRTGFYKISQKPPMPSLELTYPADNNEFRAVIDIKNYLVFYSYLTIGHEIKYTWYEKIDDGIETYTITDISTYIKVLDLLPERKYEFRVEAKNKYGVSWSETVELETPPGVPDLTSFYVTNTFVNSTLNWTFEVDEEGATSITQYDISRSVLNYLTGTSYSEILYDVSNNTGLTNIPPIYSYKDNNIELGANYTYYVTPYAIDQPGEQVSQTISIGSGVPEFVKGIYYPVENKIIISWITDKVDVSNNPLANTSVSWDISKVRVDDISVMDTIVGISGEKIYKKTYEITNDFLIPDYNYNFSVRAHYTNNWLSKKSIWSKSLIFKIDAPVPQNVEVNYINEQIKLNWDHTTLYNLMVTYSLQYEYDTTIKTIDLIKTNNVIINGRSLPGGKNINFKIKANYPNFSSKFSDDVTLNMPKHKPVNVIIRSYDNLNYETKINAASIKISWDVCPGALHYSLKRYDIYYGNLSPTEPSVIVSNITTNSYTDTNEPLGVMPSVPRRYKYKITANY